MTATVIDELVIKLGLDPRNFNENQKKALEGFKDTVEGFGKQAQIAEDKSKSLTDFLSSARTQALSLFAVFTGAKGLVDFTEGAIRSTAAIGQLSHSTGVSVGEISKLQGLMKVFGGDAAQASAQVVTLSDAVSGMKLGHISPIISLLRGLQANGGVQIDNEHGPVALLASMAENLKNIRDRFGADVAGNIGRQLGLQPALFEAMINGAAKFNDELGKIKGLTEADAKAALELQQRWDGLAQTIDVGAKRGLFELIDWVKPLARELNKPISEAKPWDALFGRGGYAPAGASFADRFPGGTGGGSGNPAYRDAIASIESKGSGGYAAVGPVTASGDRAYGRYQIMGNNIGPWSEAALGRRLSIQEFMASQQSQDAIFDHQFGGYVKKYGNPQDAASAWLTGRPLSTGGNARDLYGTSGSDYAARFTNNLRGIDRGGGSSSDHSLTLNGPVNITMAVPAGQNADQFAGTFAAALKRQALAAQANRGQN